MDRQTDKQTNAAKNITSFGKTRSKCDQLFYSAVQIPLLVVFVHGIFVCGQLL